ncbi:MAG: hypothetical protein HYT21_02955 [Candidatus Nealsonbacteria bacterium]|nr:hypothetical protein [Candidatus Nealsonbacteria bacterium]
MPEIITKQEGVVRVNSYTKTLARVWRNTKHVWVNEDKLQQLIEEMKGKDLSTPAWDTYPAQPKLNCGLEEWINFVCWINTINFAFTNFEPPSTKFTVEYPLGMHWRGAFAMQACFMRALKEGTPVFDPDYMRNISLTDAAHIFRAADDDHQIPMLAERQMILQQVAEILLRRYDGSWLNLFHFAGWRAFGGLGIVDQLTNAFFSFRDFRSYRRRNLLFQKRAQLLVMMYQGRAMNSGGKFPLLKDADEIGPIADYEVPKTLKFLGVLEYSPLLEEMIRQHYVFMPGHTCEVENRLAMSYAMVKLCEGAGINMAQADFHIWNLGRQSQEPHILVPTTDY